MFYSKECDGLYLQAFMAGLCRGQSYHANTNEIYIVMSRLDFLSFGAGKKNPAGPFSDGKNAAQWLQQLLDEHGAAAHQILCDELTRFNEAGQAHPHDADTLEALLVLNRLSQHLQSQLRTQYLMSARMPKVMESQLRNQMLHYSQLFCTAYQRFLVIEMKDDEGIRALLPEAMACMMHYQAEHALWLYFRHFSPDKVFWTNVHQLYRLAETRGMAIAPVLLFGQEIGTTVQDQYLVLLLVSLLGSGNLQPRQINMAYMLAQRLSSYVSLVAENTGELSFCVNLALGLPPGRPSAGNIPTMRYWGTSALIEQINTWLIMLDSSQMPEELKSLREPGLDAALLRYLQREWASQPYRFERAERLPVTGKMLELAYRLPLLHKLVREPDEKKYADKAASSSDEMAEIRIYGFVTSRSSPSASVSREGAESKEVLPQCLVDNQSASGLGVSLATIGNEWVSIGGLLGFRSGSEALWSLGIMRRINRPSAEKIYLGVEILSERPVAASIRPEGSAMPELPAERMWLGGEIALFVPCVREGRKINAMVLSISSYSLGKQFYMTARGKHFLVALGKMQERGSDWCLCEIELIRQLEALP